MIYEACSIKRVDYEEIGVLSYHCQCTQHILNFFLFLDAKSHQFCVRSYQRFTESVRFWRAVGSDCRTMDASQAEAAEARESTGASSPSIAPLRHHCQGGGLQWQCKVQSRMDPFQPPLHARALAQSHNSQCKAGDNFTRPLSRKYDFA